MSIYQPALALGTAPYSTEADLSGVLIPNPAPTEGFLAFVKSTGKYYQLSLTSGAPLGPGVLPTQLGGASRWLQMNVAPGSTPSGGGVAVPNAAWRQAAWWIAPLTGDDSADGATAMTPIKTYAELIKRWGTVAPGLYQDTIITFLEGQPDLSDPVALNAQVVSSTGTLTLRGGLEAQAGANGSFTDVIAKNVVSGERWIVTDNTKPADFWAAYVGMFIRDLTTGGMFLVESNLSGSSAIVSEPLASAIGNSTPDQLTISIGNAYEVVAPTKVNLTALDGYSASGNAPKVEQVWVTGVPFSSLNLVSGAFFAECRIAPFITSLQLQNFTNCYIFGASLAGCFINGGIITNILTILQGAENLIDADTLVMAPALAIEGALVIGSAYFETTLDVPNLSSIGAADGSFSVSGGTYYGYGQLWGPCGVNVHPGGDVRYNGNGDVAFLNTGAFTIDSDGTASAFNPATNTWSGPFPIIPSNLSLNHPTGFAGCAYGKYGTKIRSIL